MTHRLPSDDGVDLINRVARIRDLLAVEAVAGEQSRTLSAKSIAALKTCGAFSMWAPKSLGGEEIPFNAGLCVIESLARIDAAAAWILFVVSGSNIAAARMTEAAAQAVYSKLDNYLCGSLNPPGRLRAVDGGYRLDGRWPFASGVAHAGWLIVSARCEAPAAVGSTAVVSAPVMCLLPAHEAVVHDTWHTLGLRATGSSDIEFRDVIVPEHMTFRIERADDPRSPFHQGSLYRIPLSGGIGTPIAAVALGIARTAIDAVVEMSRLKVPVGRTAPMRDQPVLQSEVARAEAEVRSASAWLNAMADQVTVLVESAAAVPLEVRRNLLLATVHAVQASASAVDRMHQAAGGSAIYQKSPIEKAFRDMHTLTAHRRSAPLQFEVAGKVLLGGEPGDASLLQ